MREAENLNERIPLLDATFEKVRENGRVISMAVLIATGVKHAGERDVSASTWGRQRTWSFGGPVGIFPSWQSLLRLTGALLEEQNEEWAVGRRYFSTESMNKLYETSQKEVARALLELQSV